MWNSKFVNNTSTLLHYFSEGKSTHKVVAILLYRRVLISYVNISTVLLLLLI